MLDQIRFQVVLERTVRGFVNEKIVGNPFFVDESLPYCLTMYE